MEHLSDEGASPQPPTNKLNVTCNGVFSKCLARLNPSKAREPDNIPVLKASKTEILTPLF